MNDASGELERQNVNARASTTLRYTAQGDTYRAALSHGKRWCSVRRRSVGMPHRTKNAIGKMCRPCQKLTVWRSRPASCVAWRSVDVRTYVRTCVPLYAACSGSQPDRSTTLYFGSLAHRWGRYGTCAERPATTFLKNCYYRSHRRLIIDY